MIRTLWCLLLSHCLAMEINDRPIVGIPTMKITDVSIMRELPDLKGKAYIAASYVKFIEMAGVRVVPIMQGLNTTALRKAFDSINGLLLPGGEINLVDSGYHRVSQQLFRWAVEANQNGDYFPIMGICRGMQALVVFTEESLSPLSRTDSRGYITNMSAYTPASETRILKRMSKDLLNATATKPITTHSHKFGITIKDFEKHQKSRDRYRIVSTSKDLKGKTFISIIEGKDLPFYGIQFHPEKPIFEWNPSSKAPHTPEAVELGQHFANFFASEVRKNTNHKFSSFKEELEWMVYKNSPVMSGHFEDHDYYFQQMYIYGKEHDDKLNA